MQRCSVGSLATIDLDAIGNNIEVISSVAQQSKIIAVVKADAYGHGSLVIAKALEGKVHGYAVASLEEAVALREGGIASPILILQGIFSSEEAKLAQIYKFWVVVHSFYQIQSIKNADLTGRINCWLKVNTGLNRLGFSADEVTAALDSLRGSGKAEVPVLMSHMACADEPEHMSNLQQLEKLKSISKSLNIQISLANSAALFSEQRYQQDWCRPGLSIYGCSPFKKITARSLDLKPVMTLSCKVISIQKVAKGQTIGYGGHWKAERGARVAILGIGYADGYPRFSKGDAFVYINKKRARVIGAVSMDMMAIDITDIPTTTIGDFAEIWGENILLSEVADWSNLLCYELITRLHQRVTRKYINNIG
ncbi:alanine racemase [Pseudoalteromonas sp. CO348]|nr:MULTISPECIES: alanine racemase [unclassified Pseudoalteromonas]RZG07246.1 alanine racemase [Pseudoalteromonas sp. CO348]